MKKKQSVSSLFLNTSDTKHVNLFPHSDQPILQLSGHRLGILQFTADTDYLDLKKITQAKTQSHKTAPTSEASCK